MHTPKIADRTQEIRGEYGYRMSNTNSGSERYGPCEVCNRNTEMVYHQVECRRYIHGHEQGWTHDQCHNLFGHRDCLISRRK